MRRSTWKTVSTLVTTIVIVGCQESAVVAPGARPVAPTSIANAPAGMFVPDYSGAQASLSSSPNGSDSWDYSTDFEVPTSGGRFWIGANIIDFPENSICDSKSSYGPGTWDQPCTPTTKSTKISATVHVTKSRIWIDFDKHIRFVPSSKPSHWVTLTMWDPGTMGAKSLSPFNIKWTTTIGDAGIDESATDSTLASYVGFGFVQRRIKHFTGYQVGTGKECNPATDGPDCIDDGGGIGGGGQ